jgi:hypothetical protein
MSTLTELITSVTRRTGNDDTTGIAEYINEAYVDVLLRTKCSVIEDTLPLTAGDADYTLDPDDVLEVTEVAKVASGGVDYLLERVTPQEILRLRANSVSSSPCTRYATDGMTLMLWPTPAAADVLSYYVIAAVSPLTGSNSPDSIPPQWHKALFWYACAEASDDRDDESSGQGQLYRARYEQMLIEIRKNMNRMGGRRLPRSTIGAGRSVPHDNSADWR